MTQDELAALHADAERWLKRTRTDDSLEPEIRRMLRDALIVLKGYARRRIPRPDPGPAPAERARFRRRRKRITKPRTE